MTKKLLIKWVEDKQKEALAQVQEQYQNALINHTLALHNELGVSALADEIGPLINQAFSILNAWREKWKDRVRMGNGWDSLSTRLRRYADDENLLKHVLSNEEFEDTTEERRRLRSLHAEMEREVRANYANVLVNVRALKDAKLGIEYLKELGFDVSEVITMAKEPVTTALSIPIKTQFLFLNKKEAPENDNA